MRVMTFIRGAVTGAGAMYLLDPDRGRRRRAGLRDQGVHALRRSRDLSGKAARDARNRAFGAVAEARSRLSGDEPDDVVLEERVRAALGRVVAHPSSISVIAHDGTVTLAGPILEDEVERLLDTVLHVRGVRDFVSHLDVHPSAEGVPGLQGGRPREERFELRQRNWTPAARVSTALAGGMLALYSRELPRPLSTLCRLLGLGLFARAATNLETKRMVGVNADRRAVDIQKSINVDATVEEVFEFWSRFENFPRFMSHLREVRRLDSTRSHWVALGPAGVSFRWDAELTAFEPDRLMAWRSVPGASVENAGIVRFQPNEHGGTRVDIRMTYNPPAGAIGHGIASLFGADSRHAMNDDLVRFKSLIESGKASVHGQSVRREELTGNGAPPAPARARSMPRDVPRGEAADTTGSMPLEPAVTPRPEDAGGF